MASVEECVAAPREERDPDVSPADPRTDRGSDVKYSRTFAFMTVKHWARPTVPPSERN